MTKSIGVDAGDYSIKLVELDGSYRKTKLVRYAIHRMPELAENADRGAATAKSILEALSENKISGELMLGHPCREAVLRTIDVPFTGKDAIRKVIKAEVEGAMQSQSVDDMIVDFLEIGKNQDGNGAKVLVAAVPKPGLRAVLDGLRKGGQEPEHVDLDTMALYRAADWCGAFTGDTTVPAVAADAAAKPAGATVVLDLGSRSTRVLVVKDGKLADMRSIRLGDASITEAVARNHSIGLADARTAVQAVLATGSSWSGEVAAATPALALEGDAPAPAAAAVAARQIKIGREEVLEDQKQFLQRLMRELMRFLASQAGAGGIERLWITGGCSRMQGMKEMLNDVFGMEPRLLDPLANLQHSLSPEEAETVGPQLMTAIGLSLISFGGPEGFELRQEDLAYTKGFERVKFPLAITCMVALFAAIVYGVRLNNELKNLQFQVGTEYIDPKQGPLFYGQMNALLATWAKDSKRFELREGGKAYKDKDLLKDLASMPVANRVKFFHDKLAKFLVSQQEGSGVFEDLSLESGLAVLVRFFEVLKRAEDSGLGKFMLCKFDLGMKATGSGEKSGRFVTFTVAIRGDDFRERESRMREAFESECNQPDSPFLKYDTMATKENLFADSAETGVKGAYFDVKLIVRDSFGPFGGAKQ
jgi:type IV pilus assembly protein PilM